MASFPRRILGRAHRERNVERHGGQNFAERGGHGRRQPVPHAPPPGSRRLQRPLRCRGRLFPLFSVCWFEFWCLWCSILGGITLTPPSAEALELYHVLWPRSHMLSQRAWLTVCAHRAVEVCLLNAWNTTREPHWEWPRVAHYALGK